MRGRSCTSHAWAASLSATRGGYGVGQIDLPEGVRIQAPLLGTTDDWQIGSPMGLTTFPVGRDDDGNDLVTFRFEAVR